MAELNRHLSRRREEETDGGCRVAGSSDRRVGALLELTEISTVIVIEEIVPGHLEVEPVLQRDAEVCIKQLERRLTERIVIAVVGHPERNARSALEGVVDFRMAL